MLPLLPVDGAHLPMVGGDWWTWANDDDLVVAILGNLVARPVFHDKRRHNKRTLKTQRKRNARDLRNQT